MHELSICASIAEIVRRHAAGRRVLSVSVRLGQLRQVVPETLEFCWNAVSSDAPLSGAALEIEFVPGVIECGECGERSALADPFPRCPACGGVAVSVVSGEEFYVDSIDVADPATTGAGGHEAAPTARPSA